MINDLLHHSSDPNGKDDPWFPRPLKHKIYFDMILVFKSSAIGLRETPEHDDIGGVVKR